MANVEHNSLATTSIHVSHFAAYADAAARAAATPTATEVAKLALQSDTGEYFRLVSISPTVWSSAVGTTVTTGAAAGATALQPAGNLTGTIAGTAVATVVSGAAAGATALQPAGNLTGTVNSVAVATVTAGAALGATALQPATAIAVTSIALGATPAGTGTVRLTHASKVIGRNSANSADLDVVDFGTAASNRITIGNTTSAMVITCAAGSLSVTTGVIYTASGTTPGLTQSAGAGATGTAMVVKAQATSNTSGTGGELQLEGGDATASSGTHVGGSVRVRPGAPTAGGTPTEGSIRLQTSAGVTRIQTDGTGLGLFGVTPVAQPADLGAPSFTLVADAQTWCAALRTNVLRALGATA